MKELATDGSCENDRFRNNMAHQVVPREKLLRKYVAFVLKLATDYRNDIWGRPHIFVEW